MKKTIKFYEVQRIIGNEKCFLMSTRDEELAKAVAIDRGCTYEAKESIIDAPFEETYCEDCQCYMGREKTMFTTAAYPPRHNYVCPVCGKTHITCLEKFIERNSNYDSVFNGKLRKNQIMHILKFSLYILGQIL